ncbi:MAG: hypothetical protein ACE5ID_11690, partial [Acidobacteriota bacterium]
QREAVGLEQPLHSGVAGFYFHHRSNHHLSQPGDPVTSINVLEGGYRSAFWNRLPPPEPALRWGRLDWLGRAGFLISSSFGEDRRWHLRSGARWSAGTAHRSWRPFVQVEAEAGDVSSQQFQIGLLHSTGVDLHLEFRNDRQFFGEDQTALLLASTKHF